MTRMRTCPFGFAARRAAKTTLRATIGIGLALLLIADAKPASALPFLRACGAPGGIRVSMWTATLERGKMSAPLPHGTSGVFYFDFAVEQDAVETYHAPGTYGIVVPSEITHLPHEFKVFLYGRAEHTNGHYYFSGFFQQEREADVTRTNFSRLDTLDVVLSGLYCIDDGTLGIVPEQTTPRSSAAQSLRSRNPSRSGGKHR